MDQLQRNMLAQEMSGNAPRNGPWERLTGANGPRYRTWPERVGSWIKNDAPEAMLPNKIVPAAVQAVPAIAQGVYEGAKSGVTLPGDVYTGKSPTTIGQLNPEHIERGLDLIDLAGTGGIASAATRTGSSLGMLGSKLSDIPADQTVQGLRSKLTEELAGNQTLMKQGTGQQWMNKLQKRQVKPSELEDALVMNPSFDPNKQYTFQELKGLAQERPGLEVKIYMDKDDAKLAHGFGGNRNVGVAKWKDELSGRPLDPYVSGDNYQEKVISLNPARDRPSTFSHHPQADVILHSLTDERLINNRFSYHIHEFQSDTHQQLKKHGPRDMETAKELKDRWRIVSKEVREAEEDLTNFMRQNSNIPNRRDHFWNAAEREKDYSAWRELVPVEKRPAFDQLNNVRAFKRREEGEAFHERRKLFKKAPDTPFKDWIGLGLKDAIIEATQRGVSQISWSSSDVLKGVYKDKGVLDQYDVIMPNKANKLFKKYGARVRQVEVPEDNTIAKKRTLTLGDEGYTTSAVEANPRNVRVHVLEITPELKAAAKNGELDLYATGTPLPKEQKETTLEDAMAPKAIGPAITADELRKGMAF